MSHFIAWRGRKALLGDGWAWQREERGAGGIQTPRNLTTNFLGKTGLETVQPLDVTPTPGKIVVSAKGLQDAWPIVALVRGCLPHDQFATRTVA